MFNAKDNLNCSVINGAEVPIKIPFLKDFLQSSITYNMLLFLFVWFGLFFPHCSAGWYLHILNSESVRALFFWTFHWVLVFGVFLLSQNWGLFSVCGRLSWKGQASKPHKSNIEGLNLWVIWFAYCIVALTRWRIYLMRGFLLVSCTEHCVCGSAAVLPALHSLVFWK